MQSRYIDISIFVSKSRNSFDSVFCGTVSRCHSPNQLQIVQCWLIFCRVLGGVL